MAKKEIISSIEEFSVAMVVVLTKFFEDNPKLKLSKKDFEDATQLLYKNLGMSVVEEKQNYIG